VNIERLLTLALVAVIVASFGVVYLEEVESIRQNYNADIGLSISREQGSFDYSCDQPVYGLYLKVSNDGEKVLSEFSVSITNPLCAGAVPPLTADLFPSQIVAIYVYSTERNGTVTISGNNTMIFLKF
jgi:hypothetical protein